MNYEFHVGDYVETVGGAKGYICDANKDWWYCTNADDEYSFGYVYRIVRLGSGEIHECYTRIGAYDFTKKEKIKIEPLDYIITETNMSYQLTALKSKINTLVDAVNKLIDKENNE